MTQNEITDDLEVTTQDEEETVGEEPTDLEQSEGQEIEQRLAKAEAEAAKFRRLFEKSQKNASPAGKPGAEAPTATPVDVDERILKANGMAPELLEKLKAVAQISGKSLIDAQEDELFVAYREKSEKEAKARKANLGASRGSGSSQARVTADTPGISREDHMRLAREASSK